jgi:nucleoredoxin
METVDTDEKISHHVLDSELNRIPLDHALKSYFIGLFFTASWCPPCESFANELKEVYQEANSKEKIFEVIQISNEKSEKDLENHIRTDKRNWFYVPNNDHLMWDLIDEYEVKFLPVLIIINKERVVLSKTGRLDVKELGKRAYEKWYNSYREEKNKDKEILDNLDI